MIRELYKKYIQGNLINIILLLMIVAAIIFVYPYIGGHHSESIIVMNFTK